jgi:hypothetical protein
MQDFNEKVAILFTKCFGNMFTFWAFCGWAFLPLIPALSEYKETILYISSGFIQLAALPLIMVGQEVLGRESELRSKRDHEMIERQFYRMEDAMEKLSLILHELREMHLHTHKLLKKENDVPEDV